MVYSNNPQSFFNGFISASRNVFLVSSIAIALYGYSNSFNIKSSINFTRLASTSLFIYSLCYGANSVYSMNKYINELENDKKNIPNYVQLNVWKNFMYLMIIYIGFLFIIALIAFRRFLNKKN